MSDHYESNVSNLSEKRTTKGLCKMKEVRTYVCTTVPVRSAYRILVTYTGYTGYTPRSVVQTGIGLFRCEESLEITPPSTIQFRGEESLEITVYVEARRASRLPGMHPE
jgi:hypothetical protein